MLRFRYPNHGRFKRDQVAGFDPSNDLAAAAFFAYGTLVRTEETTDVVLGSDALTGDVVFSPVSTTDTLLASDSLTALDSAVTSDTVVVTDVLTARLAISASRADTATATDSLGAGWSGVSSDTVRASDGLVTQISPAGLVDGVTLTDQTTVRATFSSSTTDTVRAGDEIGSGAAGMTTDTVRAADVITGTILLADRPLVDTVTISEVWTGAVSVYAALPGDTVNASDTLTSRLTLVGVLSDTVLAGDTLADAAYQVLVVTNADTGAASTYTLTPTVTGLAEYRGVLYLAGPDGLYALDADEDVDGVVVWTLRTGFSNLGSDLLKRIHDVNVQGRTTGDTTLQVISDRTGIKQESPVYTLPPLTRTAYRDGVIKVGKGIQSVYWALQLQGEGPAETDQVRVVVEPLSRRR